MVVAHEKKLFLLFFYYKIVFSWLIDLMVGQEVAVAVQGVEDRRGQVEEHPGLAAEEPELEVARGNKFSNSLKIHYKVGDQPKIAYLKN